MLVETFCRAPGKIGLHLGVENVQRFFPESISEIDLRLGHLQILCRLNPEFWRDKPEMFDERLSDWLESKYLRDQQDKIPLRLAMVPIRTGANIFRLRPISLDEQETRAISKTVERALVAIPMHPSQIPPTESKVAEE